MKAAHKGHPANRSGSEDPPTSGAGLCSGPALRQLAEEIVRGKGGQVPEGRGAMSPEALQQMLHELRVHQIELEMQNEELRRVQLELVAARARYFDLYDLAPVGYCTLNEKGLILEANLTAAALLGLTRDALTKRLITRFIPNEDQDIFYLHHKRLCETGEPQAFELRLLKKDKTTLWTHLVVIAARPPLQGATRQRDSVPTGPMADGEPVFRVALSDITERKRAEALLKGYNAELERRVAERTAVAEKRAQQLQSLDRRLIRAEETERQRIANVLHEEVQQILVAARMALCTGLQQVTDAAQQLPFQAADRMLLEALAETRSLVHEMSPPGLREGGLLDAVFWLSRQMYERFDFSVVVTAEEPLPPLDDEVGIFGYQAVRELLLNIDKHAKVRRAEVIFKRVDERWFKLTVRDEGVGFAMTGAAEPGRGEPGGGLFNIRERVEGFGGRLEIVSTFGRGTSVSLFLPVQGTEGNGQEHPGGQQ